MWLMSGARGGDKFRALGWFQHIVCLVSTRNYTFHEATKDPLLQLEDITYSWRPIQLTKKHKKREKNKHHDDEQPHFGARSGHLPLRKFDAERAGNLVLVVEGVAAGRELSLAQ